MKLGVLVLLFVVFWGGAADAEDVVYTQPFRLDGLLHPDFFAVEQAQPAQVEAVVQEQAAQAAGFAAVQAQFVMTAVEFLLEPEGAIVYYDVALSGSFFIRVHEDGRCFLAGDMVPVVSMLDRDCIEPAHALTKLCDSRQLSMWGWRTGFVADGAPYDDSFPHMSLGAIDPVTGELVGYTADASRIQTVYIAYRVPMHRYQVQYYNEAGSAIPHGPLYALSGSNLSWPPANVPLGIPDGASLAGFVLLGTKTEAPSYAVGPARLQVQLGGAYPVTFIDGGRQHGERQWVPEGGAVPWEKVMQPEAAEGWAFAGWSLTDGGAVIDSAMAVAGPLTLYARYARVHTITFFARADSETAFQTIQVMEGDTIDLDAVGMPPVNQRFLGWQGGDGKPLAPDTTIHADQAFVAAFAPWITQAELVACDSCIAAAFDTVNGYARRTFVLDHVPVQYDADADDYYLLAVNVAPSPVMDRLYNMFAFDRAAASWQWHDALGHARALIPDAGEKRWYLGLEAGAGGMAGDVLEIAYVRELRFYMVYFCDASGVWIDAAYPVLAGGSLAGIARDTALLALLPEAEQAVFVRWVSTDLPDMASAREPTVFKAELLPLHKVRFYLDGALDTLHTEQDVYEGQPIDWARIPQPERSGMSFMGWQLLGSEDKTYVEHAPVVSTLTFVARFVPLHAVTFVGVDGKTLYVRSVRDGEALSLSGIAAPKREGLSFSHWENEAGQRAGDGMMVDAGCVLRPVYTATVTFECAGQVCGQWAVREGETLIEIPDAPMLAEGYVFLGWSRGLAGLPVLWDTVVQAQLAVELTFRYGLFEEFMRIVVIRAGDSVTPPDAAIPGYAYRWNLDITQRFYAPAMLTAQYTLALERPSWVEEVLPVDSGMTYAGEGWMEYQPYEDAGVLWNDGVVSSGTSAGSGFFAGDGALDVSVEALFSLPDAATPLSRFVAGGRGDCFE